jgi:hypothetical protein
MDLLDFLIRLRVLATPVLIALLLVVLYWLAKPRSRRP